MLLAKNRLPWKSLGRQSPPMICPVCLRPAPTLKIFFEPQQPTGMLLSRAFTEAIEAKRAGGRRPAYTHGLKSFANLFVESLPSGIAANQVTHEMVERWINAAAMPRSRETRLLKISALFSWMVRRGIVDRNPCDRIERPRIEVHNPKILTVEQCSRLLSLFQPRSMLWLCLGLWAGLRPDEAMRTPRGNIRPQERIVIVDAAASKVRRRRIVPLRDNAAEWISRAMDASTVDLSPKMLYADRKEASRAAGIIWTADVLRHTHASMRIAAGDTPDRVAADLGNSVSILLTHYRELVRREDAEEFWRLRPPMPQSD
jgi:integrase